MTELPVIRQLHTLPESQQVARSNRAELETAKAFQDIKLLFCLLVLRIIGQLLMLMAAVPADTFLKC